MRSARRVSAAALAALALLLCVRPAAAGEEAAAPAAMDAALAKGRAFLVGKRDAASGGWGDKFTGGVSAGYSAMVVAALAGSIPREGIEKDEAILAGLDYIVSVQKADGSIASNARFSNYETAAALLALSAVKLKKHAAAHVRARDYLASIQVAGDESRAEYGGFPYSPGQSTDLSNLQLAASALHAAELPADSSVWKRMQTYLARVQNRSESNVFVATAKVGDTPVEVVSGNDGGAVYAPGVSKLDLVKRPDGRFEAKSYGSMTYALLKCLLFSGVRGDDPRVAAAVGWVSRNFTVDRNPGFESAKDPERAGQQGYYYYLLTMAQALATYEKALGKAVRVRDEAGREHDWRQEIAAKLLGLQKADGSWVNEVAERWDEGNALLATAYAMQTLSLCAGTVR